MEGAFDATRLAVETIEATVARAPDAALRRAFEAWPRVQAVREDFERARRVAHGGRRVYGSERPTMAGRQIHEALAS